MPCKGDAASVSWISDDAGLRRAAEAWEDTIGIDTEFQRTNTYYPVPGLYQVWSGDTVYLLDPLTIRDWQPLVARLEDAGTVKIMHACSEDLELMSQHLGSTPVNLFDTQLANAFVSPDFSTSYTALVESLLGVTLGKPETRSDWLKRPLSDQQIRYAREDVHYLPELHRTLSDRLSALGRAGWFADAMSERARYDPVAPDDYYRTVQRAWRLEPPQLAVLRALCAWRERTAMAENVPRKRVVWDEHLVSFAQRRSLGPDQIAVVLPHGVARRYGGDIVAEHERARAMNDHPGPLAKPLTQRQGSVSKELRRLARETAAALGLAQELLARKREVETCIRHFLDRGELSAGYRGWRYPLVGARFEQLLQAEL